MSQESHESLSAAMDGELSSFELRRLAARLADEPELSEKWGRYHLSQQLLHGSHASAFKELDLSSRISSALEQEETYSSSASSTVSELSEHQTNTPWWKPVTSMAVAASVTAMVILGGQQFVGQTPVVDDSLRQNYTIAPVQSTQGVQQVRYGDVSAPYVAPSASVNEPEVLRLPQGVKRYLNQHQHMLDEKSAPVWETSWLPKGFAPVRHEVVSGGEVMVFSDGKYSVSISVEPLGNQSLPTGVVQIDGLTAVGIERGDRFVTVVGDVPVMIADRIAQSVRTIR